MIYYVKLEGGGGHSCPGLNYSLLGLSSISKSLSAILSVKTLHRIGTHGKGQATI